MPFTLFILMSIVIPLIYQMSWGVAIDIAFNSTLTSATRATLKNTMQIASSAKFMFYFL